MEASARLALLVALVLIAGSTVSPWQGQRLYRAGWACLIAAALAWQAGAS